MEQIEDYFTGVKNLKMFYRVWLPDDEPKAVVQILHGFGDHSGRWVNVENALVPAGYAVFAADQMGFGKSEGERDYADSYDQFIANEKTFFDLIRAKYLDLPIFLLGHSMGSVLAQHFMVQYQSLYKGLILSGIGTRAGGNISSFIVFMGKIMSKIAPHTES